MCFFFVFSFAFGLKVGWELGAYCRHVGCNYEFRIPLIRNVGVYLEQEVACLNMHERRNAQGLARGDRDPPPWGLPP